MGLPGCLPVMAKLLMELRGTRSGGRPSCPLRAGLPVDGSPGAGESDSKQQFTHAHSQA